MTESLCKIERIYFEKSEKERERENVKPESKDICPRFN